MKTFDQYHKESEERVLAISKDAPPIAIIQSVAGDIVSSIYIDAMNDNGISPEDIKKVVNSVAIILNTSGNT